MNGLLLTMTEPLPEHEEEFNAWYDDEHLPERLSIPGFVSTRRWMAEGRCELAPAPELRAILRSTISPTDACPSRPDRGPRSKRLGRAGSTS